MGKRTHQRLKTVIPVRVQGVDSQGKPFAELVHTLDLSYTGVRIAGLSALLSKDSVISVLCKTRKSQFSVSWVGNDDSPYKRQIGLRNLEPQRDIFGASLKDQKIVDDFEQAHGPPPDAPQQKGARGFPAITPAKPQPVFSPPVAAPKPATMAKRLAAVTAELDEMDKLLQSGTVKPEVLAHFRDALSRVRTSAWALQQSMDLDQSSPQEVLTHLNAERIAVATRLCDSLYQDLPKADVSLQKEKLKTLLTAVEKLFTRLAATDLSVLSDGEDLLADPQQAKKPRAERA